MAKKYNRYIIDGHSVPGVTTIIGWTSSRQLGYWRGKLGNQKADEVSDEGKNFGSKVHSIIEAHLAGQKATLTKPFDAILENFKNVTKGWEIVETEKELLNKEYMYGGTCDLLVKIDGELTLVDIKTGGLYDNKELAQLAGYDMCLKVEKHGILQLDKDTTLWEFLPRRLGKVDYDAFLAYKTIMEHQKGTK